MSKSVDIFLILGSSKNKPNFPDIKSVYIIKTPLPLNLIELFAVCLYVRLSGYKKFYTHYFYYGAICSSLVAKLTKGKTFYWTLSEKAAFMSKWKWNLKTIKTIVLDDWLYLLSLRLTDYLVTGTEYMADYHTKHFRVGKERIKIIPNWVNMERFTPKKYDQEKIRQEMGIPLDKNIVLFVHWLSPRKGSHHLVNIAKEVIRRHPDTVFLIVGEGPYKDRLEQEVIENHLEEVVKVLGGVPNKDVPRYYAVADVFIMPSDEEGFGRVLLEAMAMDIPIVATYQGSQDYILTEKQRQFTVEKGDITDFGAKIGSLLESEALREELKKEGFEQVKHFSKETIAGRFLELVGTD
ncbi:glycosyltransferase family 4 protein [Chloroflexota bacterium]